MGRRLVNETPRQECARVIGGLWSDLQKTSVDTAIQIGRTLNEAKANLEHGEWGEMIAKDIPFSHRTANCFMSIADSPRLSQHVAILPPSWGTLYDLSRLSDDEWDLLIDQGTIHPEMERADIAAALADDDEDEGGGGSPRGSTFRPGARAQRSNEAWDTVDGRLIPALLKAMPGLKSRLIWEPAAGRGLMVEQLRLSECVVDMTTDIEPRAENVDKVDFLSVKELPADITAIVTNPPWGDLLAPFVRHAVEIAGKTSAIVAMLVPISWITNQTVADLTGHPGFDALVVPRFRAKWLTEEEEAALDVNASPKMNHAWAVWDFGREEVEPSILFVDKPVKAAAIAEAAE